MFSILELFTRVMCVDHFDPYEMNIPELIEQKELMATFLNEGDEAFKDLFANLDRDLHSFESDSNSPNNFQNFSKDIFEKMGRVKNDCTRVQSNSEGKMDDVLSKYADKNPKDVDPEDVIRDFRVLLNDIYGGLTTFVKQFFEAKKETVEKVNRNAYVSEETREIAKKVISTSEKQFEYIKKLHQLHEKGLEKAAKMHFKGGKKMSPTKILMIVGLVLVGVVILAVIAYYATKPKISDETQSSNV